MPKKERAALKSEIVNGMLKVAGDKNTYVRDPIRSMYLDVTDLRLSQSTQVVGTRSIG